MLNLIRYKAWWSMPRLLQMIMFSTQSWIACWEGLFPWQKTSIKWLYARLSLNLSCLIYGGLQVFQEITRYPRYLHDNIPDYSDSYIVQQATHFCTVLYTLACFEIQFKTLKSVSVCFKRDSQLYFYPNVVPIVLCSSYSITIIIQNDKKNVSVT